MSKKNLLNSIKVTAPRSNVFDLSHDVKLSTNMGKLVPVMVEDCVPGDHFKISCQTLIRLAPLVAPIMQAISCTIHYFFVPKRLLWANWENYIVNNLIGGIPYAHPYVNFAAAQWAAGGIPDYMGIDQPVGATSIKINPMAFAAYQLIWNEYYRDQNLQAAVAAKCNDGDNTALYNSDLSIQQYRCWEHDYFTSCLPLAQKNGGVNVPMGDVALKTLIETGGSNVGLIKDAATHANAAAGALTTAAGTGNFLSNAVTSVYDPNGTLKVNAGTINDLRRAYRLQEWLEKAMRGGSRYIESILAHFGVKSSDKRLQRPEYITGTKSPVVISEVLNTNGTGGIAQGTMAGHGFSVNQGNYGGYFCEEHGYIIGILSVMPKTGYVHQTSKHWFKTTDFTEHYFPEFANIGEQEVYRKELYFDNTGSIADQVFGYLPRYTEYKFVNSRVAGKFRSNLNYWHMSRDFAASPLLNASFVKSDPTFRVFAVTDPAEDHLFIQHYNKVIATRRMPKYGTPTF